MPLGIFVTVHDVMKVMGYTDYHSAWVKYKALQKQAGKEKGNRITMQEFCGLIQAPEFEVVSMLEN